MKEYVNFLPVIMQWRRTASTYAEERENKTSTYTEEGENKISTCAGDYGNSVWEQKF